ncbi:hypothetical protein E2C01_010443 [Portunus trituberculatus]|uniref:Uncharacterized protein n=1 Tax=Portunus trituberculatus TaxID=210409 RepID=A0A5B7D8D2_PORTR|nr:hypothetical protein [Portunus trituberculatus]
MEVIHMRLELPFPPARKPLPRVRKSNLHSDRGQDSNPCAWRPSDPKARMVPLYHGGCTALAGKRMHKDWRRRLRTPNFIEAVLARN